MDRRRPPVHQSTSPPATASGLIGARKSAWKSRVFSSATAAAMATAGSGISLPTRASPAPPPGSAGSCWNAASKPSNPKPTSPEPATAGPTNPRPICCSASLFERNPTRSGPATSPSSQPPPAGSIWRFSLILQVVGLAGFEPTTPCPPGRCATRLRYSPFSKRVAKEAGEMRIGKH